MKNALFALLAAAAILLSGCTTGSGPTEAPATFTDIWGATGQNWASVAVMAAILSIVFASIPYAIGYGFNMPQLKSWAKEEVYQGLASALIVALVVGFVTGFWLFAGITNLSGELAAGRSAVETGSCSPTGGCSDYGTEACLFSQECGPGRECVNGQCTNGFQCVSGKCSMSCATLVGPYTPGDPSYHIMCARRILNLSQGAMIVQADQLLNVNMRVQILSAFYKNFDISLNQETGQSILPWICPVPCHLAFGIAFNPYAGVSMFGDALGTLFTALFAWISSFIAQEFFLGMIQTSLFPVLLALGVILRSFFFTRRLGGLLMAIAIGLYTVYPLMYILMADQFVISEADIWYDRWSPAFCICDTSKPWWYAAKAAEGSLNYDFTQGEVCPVRFCSLSLPLMITLGVAPDMIGLTGVTPDGVETAWLFTAIHLIGRMIVPGIFIPIVSALVTISFIKTLSPLLGGDVEIAGLTHLI